MGVEVQVVQEGKGVANPQNGEQVTVHYTETLTDVKKLDSSRDRNKPFKFRICQGEVIKGWDEGWDELTCSPDYGYGARGFPGVIPPNSTLVFDVELIAID